MYIVGGGCDAIDGGGASTGQADRDRHGGGGGGGGDDGWDSLLAEAALDATQTPPDNSMAK